MRLRTSSSGRRLAASKVFTRADTSVPLPISIASVLRAFCTASSPNTALSRRSLLKGSGADSRLIQSLVRTSSPIASAAGARLSGCS